MFGFFGRSQERETARRLYSAVLTGARQTTFYENFEVPDTIDGRFDMVALHAFLVLRRLKRDHPVTARLSQALFDLMFIDMDENLREMGVGDLAVGRRVKDMAKAFLGRVAAYEDALAQDDGEALVAALRRNLFRGTVTGDGRHIVAMADYVRRQEAALADVALEELLAGNLIFRPMTSTEHREGM
ncbi:MAG: ubiquinol-cytochrome C chaperone family protein [Rhodospirillales bacterium]|nr:ubiquinol-cytochrome C chaperone family protein [Rhodospirillales bacterium]